MIGMTGLQTLDQIKQIDPSIPIVMATKNEEESLMEQAIGKKIDDYLTKPINPAQVLLVCKKFLEGDRINKEVFTQDYLSGFAQISAKLFSPLNWAD
jgi:CheY-like chemotaxis protein